jgi:hypothetical protein
MARLVESKENFELHTKSSSIDLLWNERKNRFKKPRPNAKFLTLYAKVKKDAKIFFDSIESIADVKRMIGEVSYFQYDLDDYLSNKGKPDECIYIDISAAYWTKAREVFLSEDTYEYGLNDKANRLKVLGALAAKTVIDKYENGVKTGSEVIRNPFADLFFLIQYQVDRVVNEAFGRFDCFGYWVDAVFTRNKAQTNYIIQFFKENGYNVKANTGTGYYKRVGDNVYFIFDGKEYYRGNYHELTKYGRPIA